LFASSNWGVKRHFFRREKERADGSTSQPCLIPGASVVVLLNLPCIFAANVLNAQRSTHAVDRFTVSIIRRWLPGSFLICTMLNASPFCSPSLLVRGLAANDFPFALLLKRVILRRWDSTPLALSTPKCGDVSPPHLHHSPLLSWSIRSLGAK
jgi:hypothetical protein